MLVSINPVYVVQSKMINACNNLLIQKRNKLAIGFLCHLQAHRNCTLLVGWFVYLLGMREKYGTEKLKLFFRTVEKCALKSACDLLLWKMKEDER